MAEPLPSSAFRTAPFMARECSETGHRQVVVARTNSQSGTSAEPAKPTTPAQEATRRANRPAVKQSPRPSQKAIQSFHAVQGSLLSLAIR